MEKSEACGHRTRGRPSKKSYDPEKLMQELTDAVTEIYYEKLEIKATALELDLPPNKVKKLLITSQVISYPSDFLSRNRADPEADHPRQNDGRDTGHNGT